MTQTVEQLTALFLNAIKESTHLCTLSEKKKKKEALWYAQVVVDLLTKK